MVSPLHATRPEREKLPRTEVGPPPCFTQSLTDDVDSMVALDHHSRPRVEGTAVRAPSGSWISDDMSQIGEPEFGARYRMRDVLGHGGMGEVRLARDLRIGRDVAAKFLQETHASNPELRERFMREACLQGQLEHPSIVPVHDVGVAPDGRLYFTMKRVRGMTLQEIINRLNQGDEEVRAKFSRRKLLTAFSNVCLTVAFAHEQGVIHRDLKPANVMLGDFGETYVLDWGLAKITGEASQTLIEEDSGKGSSIAGTPGYMAPEQIGGDPDSLSERSDVYALGAILFELLTLRPLHTPGDKDSMISSTLNGADARASVRMPDADVPPELETICVKATAFVPEKRFRTVQEMHNALEAFIDGDRDLALRSALVQKHVRDAEEAIARSREGEEAEEEEHRSTAIQEIGRAIALDPTNSRAIKNLVRLLVEPPRRMPQEALEAVYRVEEQTARSSERTAALAYSACFLSFPMLLWMGVREWGTALFLYTAIAGLVGSHLYTSRVEVRKKWHFYLRYGMAFLAIAAGTRIFGPLVLAPACVVANTMGFMLSPYPKYRQFVSFTSPLMILLPMSLEWVGLLPPSYIFMGEMMCMMPGISALPPMQTMFLLIFVSVGVPMAAGHFIAKARARLRRREKHVHLYSWHLQQLVPKHARTNPRVRATRPTRAR